MYKFRLVAKGYSQVEGIDFGEIFSPNAKLTSLIFILSIVAISNIEEEQMDVKRIFLHGDLEEEIYMKQPKGFIAKGRKELVCKMKNSLYGVKKYLTMWYPKFDNSLLGIGLSKSKVDNYVYSNLVGDDFIYVVLYVCDMLLIGSNKKSSRK